MAGLTVDQWKANRRKSERNIANSFFSEVSQMNGINELMKQQDSVEKIRNMQQVKTRVNSLLQQADGVRQYYANAGNKKMMKSVEDASTYLKNINSGIDKYMPSEEKVKQITTNQSIYDNNRNSTFQQLTDKQVQNKVNATDKNRAELENENNILEQIKNEKGTDNDYKSIVAYAKNKVKELESGKTDSNIDKKTTDKEFNSYKQLSRDNDKFTTNKNNDAIQKQIDSYKQIIDEYSDYDKYGKSNMAKWSAETKDMDYAQRQDYIKKLNTNNSQNKLEEKISGYESGKEYLNSLADGEKATAQGFFDYLDNNNRNFISEARRNGKNAQKEEQRLYNLEEKSKKWEEGSNDRAIKTEYLDKMAKSNLNSYEDYETLYNEYDERRKNAKSLQEENDIKLDWNNNYGDEYLRKKQEHNFNNLADEDKTKVVQTVENGSNSDELKAQLMDKYGYDDNEANAVINYAQAQKNEATAEQEQKDYAKYGKEHPYVGTAASVPLSLASGAGYVGSMWEKLKRATGTSENPIDYNSDANRIGQNAQSLREGVKENMKTDVGKFVYDAFASTLDSAATIPLNLVVPGATTLILGSSAATSSMLDVHNKGASDSQALMTGLGAGVFEGLFEKVSLDKVVSMSKGVNSIKNFLKNTVKSMGIEGSEEGFTEIANIVYDNLVNGELSDYQQSIQSYMQQGYTKTDAEQEARKDMAVRIAENVGGGAIGGAFFSIPLGGYNYAKGKAYRQMSEKGQNIINNGTYSEIENHIRENYGEDSEVYSQFKNADTSDPAMVGYIANTVAADEYNKATQSYVDAVAPAISERLQELDVPKNEADNIAMQSMERMMNGNGRKNVDAGQYQEAYDTVEKELINHMQGNETDWTSRMDLSEYRTHQENAQDMVKLANGESLKPTLDENTQSKLNAEMDEKQSNGEITEGGAHLIDNPSVNFEPVELMVNKEGKTIVISKDGQNYNMEDVAADRDTVALYELGESYEPEQRKKFFKAYAEGGTLVDPVDFAANYKVAYDYGAQNKGIASATSNRRIRTNMTLDQIALAYTAGKMEYKKNLNDRVVVTNNTRGSVSFDNVDTTKLDETQKSVVRVAELLSEVTGAKYVFYESKQDANGKYIGENGSYNSATNEIRIDINAGKISANQGNNIMIATLAHELTHYIQNFSTTQYAKLEEFVFDALTKSTGINIDELIADEINSLKKTLGEDITEDVARKELVARGCELMLTDANSIKELAKRDKGLFGKIKAKIDEWVKNIIKACNSIINKDGSIKSGTVSKEAMLLKDFALQMRTMWNEALKEAGESNSRIVSKNVDVLDMVRYDANNKPYVEIDEDILDGVAEEDYEQTAKNVLTELFKEGIDYKNNVFTMNKRDKNEFVRNRTMTYWLHNNKKLRMDKLRLSKNAMEIIKNADNWKNVEKKYNNTNNEKIVDFAYGYVNVSVFGNDYSAKVVTGVDKRGIIHLYDISDMMPTEIKRSANTTVHPKRGASIFNGASIDESINEDRKNVNKNILYSYAGRKSANVDFKELEKATDMEKKGKSFKEIFRETGWFRGMDNIWRYEIDDSKMTYDRRGRMALKENQDYRRYEELSNRIFGTGDVTNEELKEFGQLEKTLSVINKFNNGGDTVADYIQHDKLFNQYPFIKAVGLKFVDMNERGMYDKRNNTIYVNNKFKSDTHNAKRTILHELQHVIQNYEGFAAGASVQQWNYLKNSGENINEYNRSYISAQKKINEVKKNAPSEFMDKYRELNQTMIKAMESHKDADWKEHMILESEILENPEHEKLYQELEDARYELAGSMENVRSMTARDLYDNTAGEIEARDTSGRMYLNGEERREKLPEKGNENTVHRFFSLRQSVEETKDLIAVHNLSEKNLLENIKLGGFPMPSIAITKANNSYNNFGDISVVFKKDTINPSMEENKVYSGDAWTPMFPRTEWKLNEKAMKKMADMFNTSTNHIEQYVKDPETAVKKLKAEPKVKEAFVENEKADIEKKTKMPDYETKIFSNEASRQFIEENNITVDDIMENDEIKRELANKVYPPKEGEKNLYKRIRENLIERLNRYKLEDDYEIFKGNVEPIFDQTSYDEAVDEYVNKHSEQYTKYIEDALENVYEDKYLVKEDVEPLKADGERKSFNELHMPYEINNIVTLMKKQKKGKGGGFFGGAGNLKGAATETFTSIDEIRRNKYKIQNISEDELRKKYHSLNSKIQEIDNYILGEENDGVEARLRKTENINETMVEAFALDKFTKSNVKKKFNDSNIEITDSVYEQMKELRDELKEIPVQYFEAKPERAVSTNEIAYVVVPNSVSEKTKEALRKNGIEYKEYAAGDKEARKKAVNSDSTVLFQNRNYSYDELVKKPPINIPVVKAKEIGEINRKSIVEMAMNNIKSHKGIEFRGKNPVVTNIDTGDKIQVTSNGIRHGLAGRTNEAGILVTMNLTEAIENGIKVNEASVIRNKSDGSYILIGAMDNEANERYYYRLVVNRYESNNMGTYYVDDLYAAKAKKEETFTASMPTKVTANADTSNISSKLNVSDFLEAVNGYYGLELSKDVRDKLGIKNGKSDIEGLMYQKRYSEPRTYEEALKQNKEYRDIINNLKSQFEITKGHKVGAKGISRLTSRLIRETNTAIDRNTLSENLNEVFNTAVKEGLSADEVVRDLKSVVYTALNDRKENYKITDYSKGILDDVRTTPIRLSESQKAEIEYTTGMTYNDWRKSMFGKLRINENGTALDSIWGELSAKYPATFDSDTNWRDQPAVLMNIIEDLKTDYENEYGFDFEDAADYIAGELLEEYNTLPEVKTYADRQKEKLNGLQAEYNDKVSKLRKRYSDNYREYKKKLSQEVQKSKQEWREEQKYREENLKMKYQAMIKQREANIRNRENSVWNTREKEKVRNSIIRNVKSISRKIVTPTNTNHIPEGFRQKTAEFCKEFLKDTSVFSYDDLDRLRVAYEALGRSTEDTYLRGSYDEDIDNMLYTLRDTIKNKRLAQLTRVELEQVKDITDHFAYIIKNENEIFTNGKKMEYTELSKKALRELSSKKEKVFKRTKSGTVNTFMDKAGNFMYDNYTPIYFFKELGPTFESLYTDVRKGQDKWGKNIAKAADYMQNAKSEYGYDKWDNKKLELTSEIKLTREQAMYLYATAKREKLNKLQNAHHLKKGGIIFEDRIVKEGKVINAEKTQKISYKVTDGDLIKIDSFLTKEQKAYADKMVKYLSNDMASLGNETSMQLYGIKKFGESYYFPYKVASSEKQTSADGKAKINSTLKSQSFTKSTVKEARNAVVIGNFTDAVAEHIDRMCTYNALAVAQDNINRVYNYRDIIWEEDQQVGSGMTIKQVLESVGGKKAGNYLDMFLLSINDGIKADPTEGLANQLIGSFKKGAVYASASVMIQQPSAICRAFALVNPKYFAETVFTKRDWEECKKYNGVAVVKELGGFDTGVGQGTIDYITDRKEESKFGRAISKTDDILGSLPGKMDELTWCHIWNAIKAETADKYNLKGEELLNKASERFDEVINLSQVYDSVLAKSVNMNSKSALMKSATAFMAEPTVTWNMFTDALRSKKKGYITKVMSAIILQTVVNAGLKALIQAARNSSDDDKDKSYVEKYVKAFSGDVFGTYGLTGDLSPLTWIPFVKDVVNIFEGYDVERADMTLISDVADAYKKVSKAYFGDGDVESKVEAGEEMAQSLAAFFGIPLKNMLRDYNATKNLFNDVINKNMTSTKQVGKAFMEGMGFEYSNKKYINEYISTGDRTTIKDIEDNKRKELKEKYPLYSDKQIEGKVNAYVKSQITSQIKSRYLDGDEKEKAEIIDFMKKSKLYLNDKKKDESRKTVREWEVSRLKDEYIQADSQKTRKEIRTKLWNTGKWKNKKIFNKTLKSWISD